jgi:phospholipase/lecithinase/hemolysin
MLDYAQANSVPLVNIIELMRGQNQDDVFMDHVHPTAAGHVLIAEELASRVQGLDSYSAVCRAGSNGGSAMTSLTTNGAPN